MTPKDVVWKRGKMQLYRYHAQTAALNPIPTPIAPWLGISRPYVLDMLPGHSTIEFLVQHGTDVYMLDWGVIAEEDKTSAGRDRRYHHPPRYRPHPGNLQGVANHP